MNFMKPPASSIELHLQGLPASPGIAIGPAMCVRRRVPTVAPQAIPADMVEQEVARFRDAMSRSVKELQKIKQTAFDRIGKQASSIFDAQLMMLTDDTVMAAIEATIHRDRIDAENATLTEFSKLERVLLESHDSIFRDRADDIRDMMERIVRNLQRDRIVSTFKGEAVVVAETLSPADTIVLSRNRVLAFVMDGGGLTSHAVILARSLGIPAVIGVRTALDCAEANATIIVDGDTGAVVINPAPATLKEFEEKRERLAQLTARLGEIAG